MKNNRNFFLIKHFIATLVAKSNFTLYLSRKYFLCIKYFINFTRKIFIKKYVHYIKWCVKGIPRHLIIYWIKLYTNIYWIKLFKIVNHIIYKEIHTIKHFFHFFFKIFKIWKLLKKMVNLNRYNLKKFGRIFFSYK